jgi:beta-galactosidase
VFHVLPHWNWEGKEGDTIPVFCYTNYDSVELFVNGKSYGIKKFKTSSLIGEYREAHLRDWETTKQFDMKALLGRYRLMWMDVTYQPGTLKAVAYQGGEVVDEKTVHTAGEPFQLNLIPYAGEVKANGDDLAFITVEVLDEKGNLCPNADNLVNFEVEGGKIEAVGNGDPTCLDSFKDNKRKAFYGKCMLIIRPEATPATIKVSASSEGLMEGVVEIKSL